MDTTSGPRREHWETVYGKDERELSWYQADPGMSLRLVAEQAAALPSGQDSAVIDAGGGASSLASRLVSGGFTDVTVIDIADPSLLAGAPSTGAPSTGALPTGTLPTAAGQPGGERVTRIQADLLTWRPERRYQIWHDRAVFHFLTEPGDRAAYFTTLRAALAPGGAIVMAAFAPDGPAHCSGLPVARYDAAGLAAELTTHFDGTAFGGTAFGGTAFGDAVTVTGHWAEEHRTPWDAIQPFTWITARLA